MESLKEKSESDQTDELDGNDKDNLSELNYSKITIKGKEESEHWKKTVEVNAEQTAAEELYEKTDGLTGKKLENECSELLDAGYSGGLDP